MTDPTTDQVTTDTTCMLTEGCIGEAGHDEDCVIDGDASILDGTDPLAALTTVTNTFKQGSYEPKVIAATNLVSRDVNNPIPIPDEGLTFTVIYGPEGEEVEQSIRLHQALCGLNMRVNQGNSQSQAQTFASFAVQAGYTDESQMLADPDLEPFLRLQSDRFGKIYCKANNAIDVLETRADRQNAEKARITMNSDGRPIAGGQKVEALRLVGVCKEEGLFDLRNNLLVWLQKPNDGRGHAGDLSYDMNEVHIFLDGIYPDRKKERRAKAKQARVSQQSGSTQVSTSPVQAPTGPKRF